MGNSPVFGAVGLLLTPGCGLGGAGWSKVEHVECSMHHVWISCSHSVAQTLCASRSNTQTHLAHTHFCVENDIKPSSCKVETSYSNTPVSSNLANTDRQAARRYPSSPSRAFCTSFIPNPLLRHSCRPRVPQSNPKCPLTDTLPPSRNDSHSNPSCHPYDAL